MDQAFLWTQSKARLQCVCRSAGAQFNWLFLPGGPGLGSESLTLLLDILKLPGTFWLLDLPGDGSNTTSNNKESFAHWSAALIEAVSQFKHVILVAHSTGGMYVLSTPEIEEFLEGLVLLDSAPDAGWQVSFNPTELETLQKAYRNNPTNETLKSLTVASAPYLFTKKGMAAGIKMLKSLPYNCESYQWSEEHFDQTYFAKWVPQTIPTLILSGEQDLLTPLRLFENAKQFQRKNIVLKSIENGGHFPWIENPDAVLAAFKKYCASFN